MVNHKKFSLYLAHPFDSRFKMRKWELKLEKELEIEITNPFYDVPRKDIAEIDLGRKGRYRVIPKRLVERDIKAIKGSDGILAIVSDSRSVAQTIWERIKVFFFNKPLFSIGTIMEIVYANVFEKPIYLIVLAKHPKHYHEKHPWLRYHATQIFTSLEECEEFLRHKRKMR